MGNRRGKEVEGKLCNCYSYWIGFGYFFGIMSHPLQGWMVNALAHKYGGRNFNSSDDSRNNHFVALVAFGEGFQNNHHHQESH